MSESSNHKRYRDRRNKKLATIDIILFIPSGHLDLKWFQSRVWFAAFDHAFFSVVFCFFKWSFNDIFACTRFVCAYCFRCLSPVSLSIPFGIVVVVGGDVWKCFWCTANSDQCRRSSARNAIISKRFHFIKTIERLDYAWIKHLSIKMHHYSSLHQKERIRDIEIWMNRKFE